MTYILTLWCLFKVGKVGDCPLLLFLIEIDNNYASHNIKPSSTEECRRKRRFVRGIILRMKMSKVEIMKEVVCEVGAE